MPVVRFDSECDAACGAGTLAAGDSLLAPGQVMPTPTSTVNGEALAWSRIVFAGSRHLVSGAALFTRYQPVHDPRLVWFGSSVRHSVVGDWPASSGVPGNTFVRSVVESAAGGQALLSAGVLSATALTGPSALLGRSGAFMPNSLLTAWLVGGSGLVMSEGVVLSEGLVMSESGQIGVSLQGDNSVLGEP